MKYVSEEETRALANESLALESAREAFTEQGRTFPVVIGYGDREGERFTLKSGSTTDSVGVKIGSYWPGNDAHGLARHGSSIILLNPETGRIMAAIEAAAGNAYRTAAADALATETLAREDSRVLAVFGTGHQALYEASAVAQVRPIETVLVVGRDTERTADFVNQLSERVTAEIRATTAQDAAERADIIVTATTASVPLFEAGWVRPGTHISAMGADGSGKFELPEELYSRGRLFCDLVEQSRTIGEFHRAPDSVSVTELGDVLRGAAVGRESADEVTVFDSSGFALQDLAFARALLAAHESSKAG